ncbi:MAG: ABC transporter substrate-binding protein [Deltaproteobacteria bacterium]|nr:ABC transporter substrate-binding protein [Deltaproteobacteria bacterium]
MSIFRSYRFGFHVAILVCLLTGAGPFSERASAGQKMVFAFAGFNERYGVLFVAKDHRFFEEQGLEAQVVQVRNAPIAISALAAGEAHYYAASATGSTLGAMVGGLDVVFIGGLINKLDGDFVVSPKIKSAADLKGKTIGVQSLGGGIWMFTMLTLDHWGLEPERDKIKFRVVGDQSVIVQALATGIVDAAFLGRTFSKMAERQGARILADVAKAEIPFQGTGVLARKSFLEGAPEVTEKTLRALGKSIAFIREPANKQAVTRTLAKWLRLNRQEDVEAGYETMKSLYDPRILPTKEGLRNALRILGKVDAKFARLKPEDTVDDRIARKLIKEGRL